MCVDVYIYIYICVCVCASYHDVNEKKKSIRHIPNSNV